MSIVRQLGRGLRNLLRRRRAAEEIADEVDSFFVETKADFEARGLSGADAARAARLTIGQQHGASRRGAFLRMGEHSRRRNERCEI